MSGKLVRNGVPKKGQASSNPTSRRVGIVQTSTGKYLTAETFGNKINASGSVLRKKQLWFIEQDTKEEGIFIKAHTNRYLSIDGKGRVSCDAMEPSNNERFYVEYKSEKWALKSASYGCYFGGCDDKLTCCSRTPTHMDWWMVQLAYHPLVHIKNVNRDRYAWVVRTAETDDTPAEKSLQCTEVVPWGEAAVLTLEFHEGRYAFRVSGGEYLDETGALVWKLDETCYFVLELRSSPSIGLSFKATNGSYLTQDPAGARMKARNSTTAKDEIFVIEDAAPEISVIAHNGKFMSIKQGEDVSCNQYDIEKTEVFKLIYYASEKRWAFRACNNKYLTLNERNGIQASALSMSGAPCLFAFEWHGEGQFALRAANGKYYKANMTGSLYAQSETATEKELFRMKFENRPLMILRSEHGNLGYRNANSSKIDCNRASYDSFEPIFSENYSKLGFKGLLESTTGHNGKYWMVGADATIEAGSDEIVWFQFDMTESGRIALRLAPSGAYLRGEQNGMFKANGKDITQALLFDF